MIINVTYFDPTTSILAASRTDREYVNIYDCNNHVNCQAYKNKTCILLNGLGGHVCPYGSKRKIIGYTKIAKTCGKLSREYKVNYKDQCYALSYIKHLEKCGDYIYLNLPWLDCNDIYRSSTDPNWDYLKSINTEIKEKVEFKDFVKVEYFTPEFIRRLIDFRPQAIMGGTINDYYDKRIPQFCYDLRKYFTDLYNETLKIKPEIEELANKVSFIGKSAKLKTLNPGKIKIGSNIFDWDGEKIVSTANELNMWGHLEDAIVTIYPTDNSIVHITDDNTINEHTVFV